MSLFRVIIYGLLGYWLLKTIGEYLKGHEDDGTAKTKVSSKKKSTEPSKKSSMDIQDADYEDID